MDEWFERLRKMDLVKLRILIFTSTVLSFLLMLVLLKVGAERLGLSGGVPPFLKFAENKGAVIRGDNIAAINRYLGKEVVIEDRVKEVSSFPDEDLWVVKLTYISVPLGKGQVEELRRRGIDLKRAQGMMVRVKGILKIHPIYGLQLSMAQNSNLNLVTDKVGR